MTSDWPGFPPLTGTVERWGLGGPILAVDGPGGGSALARRADGSIVAVTWDPSSCGIAITEADLVIWRYDHQWYAGGNLPIGCQRARIACREADVDPAAHAWRAALERSDTGARIAFTDDAGAELGSLRLVATLEDEDVRENAPRRRRRRGFQGRYRAL